MVTLDKPQRFMLANQFEILSHLVPKGEKSWFVVAAEAMREGYELWYDEVFRRIADPVPESVCREVLDTFDMYAAMQSSFDKSPASFKDIKRPDLDFPGYDGNSNGGRLGFAKFFCETLGRFAFVTRRSTAKDLNSHGFQPNYGPMIAEWIECGRQAELTPENVREILAAR